MAKRGWLLASVLTLGFAWGAVRAQEPAQWNVYISMNVAADLEPYAQLDFDEIRRGAASAEVHVFVQMLEAGGHVERYQVDGGEAQLLEELDVPDPVDSMLLADFVELAQRYGTARKHCVVVWGHGVGLGEERRPEALDLESLGEAAAQIRKTLGQPVDVWGYDSCLMQRLEVAYELRHGARLLVGSEDVLDGRGWDYGAWLNFLAERPEIEPKGLAFALTRQLAHGGGEGTPRIASCLDLARVAGVAGAVDRLSQELEGYAQDPGQRAAITTAHFRAWPFSTEQEGSVAFLDLASLAASFQGSEFPPALNRAARVVRSRLRQAVLLNLGEAGIGGVSIYHQTQPAMAQGYRKLAFAKATAWDEYLLGLSGELF